MQNKSVLLSIKPKHAINIFDGKKKVELRRKLPRKIKKGDPIVVYVSSPIKKIYGVFTVKKIIQAPVNILWEKVYKKSCISRNEFFQYFSNLEIGYGIVIDEYWVLANPINLLEIKNKTNFFNIPQSFRYLTSNDYKIFHKELFLYLQSNLC